MDIQRVEIMNGVFLNHLQCDKFKTSLISVTLLTQLDRDTAAMNALIPAVLCRGTANYPDMEKLSARMDELYGATIDPSVRLFGEIQGPCFYASFPEEQYLPANSNILDNTILLLAEILLNPVMKNGLFDKDYFESEREKLIELINSAINNKRVYAMNRCIEEMCCYEAISIGKHGTVQDCENITLEDLTSQYKTLISQSPIEIFYSGKESLEKVSSSFKTALKTLPRNNINYDIGTDIRLDTVEDEPRYFEETLDVTQGKLSLGFRLGEIMDDFEIAPLVVFNAVYGAGVTSKLFVNVREKLSLCYYASSMIMKQKGIMIVSSGIEFSNYDKAKDEILYQLQEVRDGNISDDELQYAKAGLLSDLKAIVDSAPSLESFYIGNIVSGLDITPEEYSSAIENVTKNDVIKVANSVALDLIYFLKGGSANEH